MNKTIPAIVSSLLLICSCNQGKPSSLKSAPLERAAVKVTTLTIGSSDAVSQDIYIGEVEADKMTTLTAHFPGTLQSIKVARGSKVVAGSTVAVIKSQTAESALQIAEATLKQAQDGYARFQKVYSAGAATEVQKVDIETQLAKAEAAVNSARKAKEDCTVKAPYSGLVSEVYPDEGVDLIIGQRIATIMDISSLKIKISVHENDINSIHRGVAANVSIPALGRDSIAAVVTDRSYLALPLSHSYECELELRQSVRGLMPGMAVKVRFENIGTDEIVIPASAVQFDKEGKYVWIDDGGIVRKNHITVLGYSGKGVVVGEGLCDNDKVIVEGFQKVSTGMKVTE